MRKKRKSTLRKCLFPAWLFPNSPILRGLCMVMLFLSLLICMNGAYRYYHLRQQEQILLEEKERLTQERNTLEQKKSDLEDPQKLEQRARDELGLVKPGEVPYVR